VCPGPTGNAVVEALGATPVTMPVPDLPQALSTNAVDGALIPWEIIPPLQLFESTKYQIEGPDMNRLGTTTFQVSMNKARWDALPDDLKEVFRKQLVAKTGSRKSPKSGARPTTPASRWLSKRAMSISC
jgi:TRAP-type C4-dicarboxylate transport system substrate-binding protein